MTGLANGPDSGSTAPETDSALMIRVQRREPDALEHLFRRYSKLVYSVALRVLRDPRLAEDLLQDVFMQLWHKPIDDLRQKGSLPALLAVITRNKCIDQIRKQKHTIGIDEVQIASSFNLVEDSEQRLLVTRVRSEMNALSPDQRQVLELAYFDGLSHSEIAARTGVPLGTVKTRIRSAVQRLTKGVAE